MKNKRKFFYTLLLSFACTAFSFSCAAQTDNKQSVDKLPEGFSEKYQSKEFFGNLYESAKMEFNFKGKSKEDFEAWKKSFLPRLKDAIGLSKIESQLKSYVPIAQKKDVEDVGSFIRERWVIWTEPRVPLPITILIPKNKKGKLPLVITPHGHGKSTVKYAGIYIDEQEKKETEENERNIAVQAVNEGYITIAPTTRGFGETRTEEDKEKDLSFSCHTELMHDLLVGRTPIGERVWDVSKIIDWAITHLDVDPSRIAVTGESGGGTVSLFSAVFDQRISIAVPAAYFCTFTGSIGVIPHCDCNYIPGMLDMGEMSDVAGLIAPRPLCVINGKLDNIFPIEESRKAFTHLQTIYAAAGVPNDVAHYEGPDGHHYYKAGSWPFIKKYFE